MRNFVFLTPFAVCLIGASLPGTPWAQEQTPRAALAPLAVVGEFSEGGKTILFNSLQSRLSRIYRIIPQSLFKKAQEEVFGNLGFEECTEETCIRKMQEVLQVDRLIVLQLVRERGFAQLSLTLVLGEERHVRTGNCVNCDIAQLEARVVGLVAQIAAADSLVGPGALTQPGATATPGRPGTAALAAGDGRSIPTQKPEGAPVPGPLREFPRVTYFVAPSVFILTLAEGPDQPNDLDVVSAFGWALGADYWFRENLAVQFFLGAAPLSALETTEGAASPEGSMNRVSASLNFFSFSFENGKGYSYAGVGLSRSNWDYLDSTVSSA
ncbi:MAG: hypothetical protein V3S29_03270, partial [bacterium]